MVTGAPHRAKAIGLRFLFCMNRSVPLNCEYQRPCRQTVKGTATDPVQGA